MISIPEVLELLEIEPPARLPGHISCIHHDEKTPSLWVSEDRWWCFGACGTGGDALDLVRMVTGASFTQAKRFLEGVMDVEYVRPERQEREVLDLTTMFESEPEGTDPVLLTDFLARWPHLDRQWLGVRARVKFCPHAMWIPHHDAEGRVTGIKTRSYYTGAKKAVTGSQYPRLYSLTRGSQERRPDVAVLCEGESDTWTMTLALAALPIDVFGLPSGVQGQKLAYMDELATYPTVRLYLDNDDAGRAGRDKATDALVARGVRVINGDLPHDYKDCTEGYVDGWRPSLVMLR